MFSIELSCLEKEYLALSSHIKEILSANPLKISELSVVFSGVSDLSTDTCSALSAGLS